LSQSSAQVVEAMARAGCSIEQAAIVLAELARQRAEARVRRRCERAVAAALFPVAEKRTPESDFTPTSKADSAEPLPRSAPIKSAARHGLVTTRRLRPAARAVGARLVEHLSLSSGRCDPSVGRLAADLQLTTVSVRRAIRELEAAQLLRREIHAGRGWSNRYILDLEAMAGLVEPIVAKADSAENRTPESLKPDSGVRLNGIHKQNSVAGVRQCARPLDPRQPQMLLPIRGQVAEQAAQRRLLDAIEAQARLDPSFNVSTLTDADWAEARRAEIRSRGSGFILMCERLGTGPPRVAATG